MIYLLTPTGGRQEALSRLAGYITQQTYKDKMRWMVIDDCDPESSIPKMPDHVDVWHVRPTWRWSGENTHAKNLLAGLALVPKSGTVIMMEDDDIYLPGHVKNSLDNLRSYELAGEAASRYYNVRTGRSRTMVSANYCALASTSVQGRSLASLRAILERQKTMLDVELWRTFQGSRVQLTSCNVIGIKGMPGRAGIGIGHRRGVGTTTTTNILCEWAGAKIAEYYNQFRESA